MKYILIAILLLSIKSFSQIKTDSTRFAGMYNCLIGRYAGKYLTSESYCVIVGHDSIAVNMRGRDMIWYVNWSEPVLLLNPDIYALLCEYYNKFIVTGTDTKHTRSTLVHNIITRNNRTVGYRALRN